MEYDSTGAYQPPLETKNMWARDDPAILLIICSLLCSSALMWGLAYKLSVWGTIRLVLLMVGRDFLATGFVVATVTWSVSLVYPQPFRIQRILAN